MNLSRAKTVLIIAFLILNITIAYQIWENERVGTAGFLGMSEEVSRLDAELMEANLILDAPLPRGGMQAAHLLVKPWRFHPEEIITSLAEALSGEDGQLPLQKLEGGEGEAYILGPYSLVIKKEGTVSLRRTGAAETVPQINSAEEMQQVAEGIIDSLGFRGGFTYDYTSIDGYNTLLHYRQVYRNLPLYAGYLQLSIRGEELQGLNIYRLEPLQFMEQEREVIPPPMALLRFLEVYENDGQVRGIVQFSLGYYSQEYDAEKWEIPPVWRIRLDSGEVFFVNAFTGRLES